MGHNVSQTTGLWSVPTIWQPMWTHTNYTEETKGSFDSQTREYIGSIRHREHVVIVVPFLSWETQCSSICIAGDERGGHGFCRLSLLIEAAQQRIHRHFLSNQIFWEMRDASMAYTKMEQINLWSKAYSWLKYVQRNQNFIHFASSVLI